MERENFTLRNQPVLILVAVPASCCRSPLQVKFIGALANLLFKINRGNISRGETCHTKISCGIAGNFLHWLPILGSFGCNLHCRRLKGGLNFLFASGGRISSRLASHAVLLTGTQLKKWSYIMKKRHMRTPIAAIDYLLRTICLNITRTAVEVGCTAVKNPFFRTKRVTLLGTDNPPFSEAAKDRVDSRSCD